MINGTKSINITSTKIEIKVISSKKVEIDMGYCNLSESADPEMVGEIMDTDYIRINYVDSNEVRDFNGEFDILVFLFDEDSRVQSIDVQQDIPTLALTNSKTKIKDIVTKNYTDHFLITSEEQDIQKKAFINRVQNVVQVQEDNKIQREDLPVLLEEAPEITVVFDSDMNIKYINNYYGETVDKKPRNIERREDIISRIHPDDIEKIRNDFEYLKQNPSETTRTEFRWSDEDSGEWVWFEAIGQNLNSYDSIDGIFCTLRDINDRKEHEKEVKRQRDRLDNVVDIMSHDLRNLMSVAMSRSEILIHNYNDENAKSIKKSLNRMDNLISDSVELAEGGKKVVDFKSINLKRLLEKCKENAIGDKAELECADKVVIKADKDKLSNLIENIYNNAIEHNDKQDLILRSGAIEENGFYIEDNGKGIPEEEREKVLKSGYKGDNSSGSGLGLKIVDEIVKSHDWSLEITESASGGARFEITGVEIEELL